MWLDFVLILFCRVMALLFLHVAFRKVLNLRRRQALLLACAVVMAIVLNQAGLDRVLSNDMLKFWFLL